jgi:ATP-dependent exoDNAse (exonuclease V) beta subunit
VVAASFPHFDPEVAIYKMRTGKRWGPSNSLYGMTNEQIVATWKERGEQASRAGTRLHWLIEQALNTDDPAAYAKHHAGQDHPELETGFGGFLDVMPDGAIPYRTEWRIFDRENRLAGTVDALFKLADGTYAIYDWKRTASVPMTTPYNKFGKPPFEDMHDTKGSRYRLQLNLYADILRRCYGMTISAMYVVPIHPDILGRPFRVVEVDSIDSHVLLFCLHTRV